MTINDTKVSYENLNDFTVKMISAQMNKEVVVKGTPTELDAFFQDIHSQKYVEYYEAANRKDIIGPGGIKIILG